MSWNKIIIFYMIFGCWLNQLYSPLAFVGYNIWRVIIIFWITINALGLISMLQKNKTEDEMLKKLDRTTVTRYVGLTILAFISFLYCGEMLVCVFFLFTSVTFMLITLYKIEKLEKKKKRR